MASIPHDILATYLYRALDEEIGIRVEVFDGPPAIKRFAIMLYTARDQEANPRLKELIIFQPASNDCIFIARKSVELEP